MMIGSARGEASVGMSWFVSSLGCSCALCKLRSLPCPWSRCSAGTLVWNGAARSSFGLI